MTADNEMARLARRLGPAKVLAIKQGMLDKGKRVVVVGTPPLHENVETSLGHGSIGAASMTREDLDALLNQLKPVTPDDGSGWGPWLDAACADMSPTFVTTARGAMSGKTSFASSMLAGLDPRQLRRDQQNVRDLCDLFDGPTLSPVLAAYVDWSPSRRTRAVSDISLDALLAVYPGARGRHCLEALFIREVFNVGEPQVMPNGVVCHHMTSERSAPLVLPGILSIRVQLPSKDPAA